MTTKTAKRAPASEMIDTLNHHLALAADLRSQVKQAHWNVVGPNFIALHKLFDEQAAILALQVDEYAERVRALQGVARGTVRMAAAESPLDDLDAQEIDGDDMVRLLLNRFETYSESLKEAIDAADEAEDMATQDIYIEAQRAVDLHAYFLRSHLGPIK